jgi:hypothetical protein
MIQDTMISTYLDYIQAQLTPIPAGQIELHDDRKNEQSAHPFLLSFIQPTQNLSAWL